ncbi:MAG: inositol monophosphatase [Patescibacteria group bacterium]|nr:inositol monophosphatase [Patescibacteria group bacterium]
MNTNDQYLKTALQAAKQAGEIFKASFGRPRQVKNKNNNPRDLVTEADLKIEKLIRSIVGRRFPAHKIIGEEFGAAEINKSDLVWIVDPIDGTTNFIQGIPFCCISIALWDSKGPLAGVVYNPITNTLYHAAKGKGAYCNNKLIHVSKTNSVKDSYSAVSWGRTWQMGRKIMPFFIRNMRKVRTFGSVALETCYVAQGSFDSFIQGRLSIWDVAAAALILAEAGGRATDWQGKAVSRQVKNLVASNGRLHKELLKLVNNLY